MKIFFQLSVLIAIFASPTHLYASSVFQCTDDQGVTTFSFTPCAAPAPVVEEAAEEKTNVVTKKAELERLDMEILELRDEIDLIKREYKDALATSFGRQNSDELTSQFDSDTMRLISELNLLQSERDRVARL